MKGWQHQIDVEGADDYVHDNNVTVGWFLMFLHIYPAPSGKSVSAKYGSYIYYWVSEGKERKKERITFLQD